MMVHKTFDYTNDNTLFVVISSSIICIPYTDVKFLKLCTLKRVLGVLAEKDQYVHGKRYVYYIICKNYCGYGSSGGALLANLTIR